ncbi:MAG: SIR2 family protein [Deltaproteobacteria bacterium]|nr:SIR2 family protein [Deltaproteobacteria bacterium]
MDEPKHPAQDESKESKSPCVLLRGRENWLARVWKGESKDITPEIVANIRQEARALCAQWLKMQNVCAFIGAGASKYVAGFIGRELYSRVEKILAERPTGETLRVLVKHVADPKGLGTSFEEFLSRLTDISRLLEGNAGPLGQLASNWEIKDLGKGKAAGEKLKKLLLDIERAIGVICNIKLPGSGLTLADKGLTSHETFLAKLVSRDPHQGRGRLFTINYDTLLEQAMDRLGILYNDGFSGTVTRRFNPASYDLDLYYPGEVSAGRVQRYDKVLHLYKMHGSINWRRSVPQAGDPFGILVDPRPLPTEQEVGAGPTLLDHIFVDPSSGRSDETLAILPTAAKYGESLSMPYAHLFRAMAQVLREPQTACFVAGYSGWDAHINRIIEDSLTNPGFTCVIVNPTLTEWARRLVCADYCGRVYAFAGDWGKFEFFAQDMLPDLEILRTDLAIAKTLRDLQTARESEDNKSDDNAF